MGRPEGDRGGPLGGMGIRGAPSWPGRAGAGLGGAPASPAAAAAGRERVPGSGRGRASGRWVEGGAPGAPAVGRLGAPGPGGTRRSPAGAGRGGGGGEGLGGAPAGRGGAARGPLTPGGGGTGRGLPGPAAGRSGVARAGPSAGPVAGEGEGGGATGEAGGSAAAAGGWTSAAGGAAGGAAGAPAAGGSSRRRAPTRAPPLVTLSRPPAAPAACSSLAGAGEAPGWAWAAAASCLERLSPRLSAFRRTRSAWASSMLEEWLRTPMPRASQRSSASLFVIPSSRASSYTRIFFANCCFSPLGYPLVLSTSYASSHSGLQASSARRRAMAPGSTGARKARANARRRSALSKQATEPRHNQAPRPGRCRPTTTRSGPSRTSRTSSSTGATRRHPTQVRCGPIPAPLLSGVGSPRCR